MTNVSVSELKAHLARHLRTVKRGGEVQILDRGVLVARLVPIGDGSSQKNSPRRARLLRAGILRAGNGSMAALLSTPSLEVGTSVTQALHDEREDRV